MYVILECGCGVSLLHQEPRMKLLFSGCIFFWQVLVISIAKPALAEVVNITLLHLSDIYEVTAIEGGRGLARVAVGTRTSQSRYRRLFANNKCE